jgi:Family of unknown function (DUF5719)
MSDQKRPAGARRAERPARSSRVRAPRLPGGLAVGALVMVALASLLVLVTPSGPGAPPRPTAAAGAPIDQTILGCPRLLSTPDGITTSYGVGLAPLDGLATAGSLSTTPGSTLALDRGAIAPVSSSTERGLIVDGQGASAQGLFSWRADLGSTTAVADCLSPRADWWFAGAGAALDHESTITLANLDSGPAVVDIRVLSPDGEVDVRDSGGTGITVPAGAHVAISLVELAPQSDDLAVRVHATQGRVVAAVYDRYADRPAAAAGYEWMPSQVQPGRVVRLSGVPATARTRTLLVANPSALESLVTVEVAGANGRFLPADVGDLSIAPGSVVTVDLSGVLPGETYAVRLRGTRPVVAALRSVQASGDLAYAGESRFLDVAGLPVQGATSAQLTAGATTSRATITAYSKAGRAVGDITLSLAPFATAAWDVPAGAAYVMVVPTQGRVSGALVYSPKRAGVAAVPLRDLPTTIRVPVVQPAS